MTDPLTDIPDLPDLSKFAVKRSDDESVARVLDDEFAKLGYGDTARLSILGDVGRENAWNRGTIFGGHPDPKNKAHNRGIISWQGTRREKLDKHLKKEGVYGLGNDDELRGMARFMHSELQTDFPDVYEQLTKAGDTYQASEALRKYIKYVPDGVYNSPDPEFRVKNNAVWAKKAKKLGLAQLPDLSEFAGSGLPDLSSFAVSGAKPSPTNPTGANTNLKPVPETPETIQAQVNSTIDVNSPKAATLLTEDSQIQLLDPALIKGLKQVKTPNGTLLVNPKKAKTLGVSDYRRDMAKLIGKVQDVGDSTATGAAVVTKAPDGVELSSSIVTTPEAAQQQKAVDAQAFPQAATQEVTPAEAVVAERETELLRGPVTEESDLLFDPATGGTQASPPVGSQPGDIYQAWLAKNQLSDDKASQDSFAVEQKAEADRLRDEQALNQPQPRQAATVRKNRTVQPGVGGQLSQPRQVGKQTDDFRRVAGEFTPTKGTSPERATIAAVEAVGRQYGITPQQVREWAAARNRDGIGFVDDNFTPDAPIQVPYSIIAEIKGEEETRTDMRMEQAEARTDPNVGLDLRVDEDETYKRLGYSTPKEAADWLNSNAGNALIAANPMFAFLDKEQRDNIGASVAGGVMGSGARAWRKLAGIARIVDPAFIAGLTQEGGEETLRKNPLRDKSAENLYKYMQSIAEPAESLEAKTGDGGIVSTVAKIIGGVPGDISGLILLSKLPSGAIVGMGSDMALQSAGRGEKPGEVATQFTKGAALGTVFKAAPIIGRLVGEFPVASVTSNALARSIGREVGTVGTIAQGSALVEHLYGSTEEQQLQTAIVNSLFHMASNGVRLAGRTVRARDAEGNEVRVGVDKDGSIKLLKGQEGKAKPDVEMFVDMTKGPDGVYRAAGDTSPVRTPAQRATTDRMLEAAPQRGQPLEQPGPSETPTPLRTSETEAMRIPQPDPAAVQKAGIDTRTRKIVDALRDKDFTSIDDIAKAAKINKTAAEDAVMTLYGAQMVEIRPGNQIRLIDQAAAAKIGDLFEKAKTYGQTPEIQPTSSSTGFQPKTTETPASKGVPTDVKPTKPIEDFKADESLAGQTVRKASTGDILTLTGEVNPNGVMIAKNQFGRDVRISKSEWERLKSEEKPEVKPIAPYKPPPKPDDSDVLDRLAELGPETPSAPQTQLAPEIKAASKNRSLSQFVRAMGGIKWKGDVWQGEIRRVSNKEMGTTGLINQKNGLSLDDMAQRAVEAGYLAERDMDAFIRALEEDASGAKKHYNAEYYNDLQGEIDTNYEAEYEKEVAKIAEMTKNKDVSAMLAGIEQRDAITDDERNQLIKNFEQFGLDPAGVESFVNTLLDRYPGETDSERALRQAGRVAEGGEVRTESGKGDAYFDPETDLDDSFNPAEFETEFAIAGQGTPTATSSAGKLKEQRDAAKRQAQTSAVTGLPNKTAFEKARTRVEADPNREITSIDLNNFKSINDKNDHLTGDHALRDAGQDLLDAAKKIAPDAQVFHLSGDEFLIDSPTGTGQKIMADADKVFSERKYGEVQGSIGGHTAQTYKGAEAGLQEAKARRKAVRSPDVVAERVAQQIDDNADAFTEDAPTNKDSLTVRPSLTQTPPQDLTPTMTARVRYAMESGMTPPDIAQRYNLTPEQVASVKPLEPVGAAGQTSHKLIRKFTPSSTATDIERAEKIAGINDLAGYMNLADVRVARDDKPADIKTAFDAVRLAIANSFGHDRLSQMTPENWQAFLDGAGTQLEVPTIEKIVDALTHQAEWNQKATAFVNDTKLGRMLDEIDDKIGLTNVSNFKTLPLQDRKAIIALGEQHGLKPHAIGQAFNQTFLDFAREESEAAASRRGSSEGSATGQEKGTSGRPRQEEELTFREATAKNFRENATERKKLAWKKVKELRDKIKNSTARSYTPAMRVELLKWETLHKEALRDEQSGQAEELEEIQFQAAPPFFSQVERTIESKMPNKASADQVRGILKDAKAEELEWLDIDSFLADNSKPTKAELLEYVRANTADVQEVVKGGKDEVGTYFIHNGEGSTLASGFRTYEEAQVEANRLEAADPNHNDVFIERFREDSQPTSETKFSKYVLPGGENYKELLLTLPEKAGTQEALKWNRDAAGNFDTQDAKGIVWEILPRGRNFLLMRNGDQLQAYATLEEAQNVVANQTYLKSTGSYNSSHWSEPNVLAHVRFDERDGGKTLHVSEIQSDWHQAGRKKGYIPPSVPKVDTTGFTAVEKHNRQYDIPGWQVKDRDGKDFYWVPLENAKTAEEAVDAAAKSLYSRDMGARTGVPNAPFKKSWHELAFKRLLRHAAENGFERVTWDTGETQADRYDLSKQVDKIAVIPYATGTRAVRIDPKDGTSFRLMVDEKGIVDGHGSAEQFTGKSIDDVVGKEIGQRIMEATEDTDLSGVDLKVGGEGMKGFYDKILPSFVNKYTKKWGGKVEASDLGGPKEFYWTTDASGFRIHHKGESAVLSRHRTRGEAQAEIKRLQGERPPVHSLDITPSMVESVMGGQPLFNLMTTPVRDEQKPLVDKMRQLSGRSIRTLSHTAKASIDKDGVVHVNPAGAALLKDIIEEAQGKDSGAFGGFFAGPRRAAQIQNILSRYADRNANRKNLQNFHQAIAEAVSNPFGDLTVVLSDPGNAALSKFSKQEELLHRAASRTELKKQFTAEFALRPAIKRDLDNLQGYSGMGVGGRIDEIVAKNLRDDAEVHLDKSLSEIAATLDEIIDFMDGKGIDLDFYAETIEPIGERAAGFAASIRSKQTQSTRLEETQRSPKGEEDQRPSRDRSGTQFSETDPNRFARLRRTDAATRSGEGSGRESDNDRLALISPKERAYIAKKAAGNQALAKAVEEEIQFSRTETKNQARDLILDVLSTPKSFKSSLDLSAAGRQGWITSVVHPKIAAKSFIKQIQSISPKRYEKFKRDLDLHPAIELAEASNLFLATLANENSLTEREENFVSRLMSDAPYFKRRVPEVARKILTVHVRASERAYLTYLDNLRINTFAALAKQVNDFNVRTGRENTPEQYEALARWVNYSTGRGDLGSFDGAAQYLNAVAFSPRWWVSRLQVLNPVFYGTLPPGTRRIVIGELAKFLGVMGVLMAIMKAAGFDVEFDDPNDPNMMKIKLGQYSWSADAALLKHLRYIWRMGDAATDRDSRKMAYLTERYVRSSSSPSLGGAWSAIEGKNFIGEPTSAQEEAIDLLLPISVDNFREAIEADGTAGLIKITPEFFGISTTRFRDADEIREEIQKEAAILQSAKTPEARKEQQRRIKIWQNLLRRSIKYDALDRQKVAAKAQ